MDSPESFHENKNQGEIILSLIRGKTSSLGLSILSENDLFFMNTGGNHVISIVPVEPGILFIKSSGTITRDSIVKALEMTEAVAAKAFGETEYIKIEDIGDLTGMTSEARRFYINYTVKQKSLAGIIFCGVTTLNKISINIGKRFTTTKIVKIADNPEEAVSYALEILGRAPGFDLSHYTDSGGAESKKQICNVTGLEITSRPEWENIMIAPGIAARFRFIGKRILHSEVGPGDNPECSYDAINDFFRIQKKAITEFVPEGRSYIKLVNFADQYLPKHSLEIRRRMFQNLKNEQDRISAFIGYNAPFMITCNLRIGWTLYRLVPELHITSSYEAGLRKALELFGSSASMDLNDLCGDVLSSPEWNLIDDDFEGNCSILNRNIIHIKTSGSFRKKHLKPGVRIIENIISSTIRDRKSFYLIFDIKELRASEISARRKLFETLNQLHSFFNFPVCFFSGGSGMGNAAVNLDRPWAKFRIQIVKNTGEALNSIYGMSASVKPDLSRKWYGCFLEKDNRLKTFSAEILDYISRINWEAEKAKDASAPLVGERHPFSEVFDALKLLKSDVESLFAERDGAIEALKRSQERYRLIVDNASDIIFIHDTSGMLVFVNQAASSFLGYTIEELLEKNVHSLISPSCSSSIEAEIEKRLTGSKDADSFYELIWKKKNGEDIWLEISSRFIRNGNSIEAVQSIARDVTHYKSAAQALKDSEDRARRILETIEDGYYEVDTRGKITACNPGFCKIIGYPDEEVVGIHYKKYMSPEDAKRVFQAYNQVYETGIPLMGFDWAVVRKDGNKIHVETSVSLIINSMGEKIGFRGIIRDVTERKRAEMEMLFAKEEAIAANEAKSRFLANMSHEMRTPMNGVLGMTKLLLGTAMTREQRDLAETINLSASSLLFVVNDILDFSKMEAGQLSLEFSSFSIRKNLDDVSEILLSQANEKKLKLFFAADADVPCRVWGDAYRVKQILINLVSNAIKFTEAGHIRIKVQKKQIDDSRITVLFSVSDTGIGIKPDDRRLLFRPFSQIDSTLARRHGGTGLGLAICRQLSMLMNGDIWYEDAQDGGSCFCFTAVFENHSYENFDHFLAGNKIGIILDNAIEISIIEKHISHLEGTPVICRPEEITPELSMVVADWEKRPILKDKELTSTAFVWLMPQDSNFLPEGPDETFIRRPVRFSKIAKAVSRIPGLTAECGAKECKPHDTSDFKGLKVLMAEDNLVNRKLGMKLFEKLGCTIDVVTNGIEAVESLKDNDYDVIVMDVQMPEMDGLEATRKIRLMDGSRSQIPILALTAHAMKGDKERCLAAGMNGYIAKPIDPDALKAALSNILKECQ